jgi:hypothetical protein
MCFEIVVCRNDAPLNSEKSHATVSVHYAPEGINLREMDVKA